MSQHQQGRKSEEQAPNPTQDIRTADQLLREMQEEVSPEAAPLWQFVQDNAMRIAIIVVTVVVLIAGYAFYQGYQESTLLEAKQELSRVTSISNISNRLTALEDFKVVAPSVLDAAINLAIADVAMELNDFGKAQSAFTAVMEDYPREALGFSAGVNVGDIMLQQGNVVDAINMYESLIDTSPTELHTLIYLRVAAAAEVAKMNDKAIKAYENAIALLPAEAEADAVYYRARVKSLSQ